MANAYNIRQCAGAANYNTGGSNCVLDPRKVKAVILTAHNQELGDLQTLDANALARACHADRPARLYPLKPVVDFSAAGGEARLSTLGYGGSKFTGYTDYKPSWTLDTADQGLKANLTLAANREQDAYFVNEDNVIFGYDLVETVDGEHAHSFRGIPLSCIYAGGQDFDNSAKAAHLTVTTVFKDYEKYLKSPGAVTLGFDVAEALTGLVSVDLRLMDEEAQAYKLVEHFLGLDVTAVYGALLADNADTCLPQADSVAYDDTEETLVISGTAKLAKPSVLFEAGVVGIEQWS